MMGLGDFFKGAVEVMKAVNEGNEALARNQVDELLRFAPSEMRSAMVELIASMPDSRWTYFERELVTRSFSHPAYANLLQAARAIRADLKDNGVIDNPTGWAGIIDMVGGSAAGFQADIQKEVNELLSMPIGDSVELLARSVPQLDQGHYNRLESELERRSVSSQIARYLLQVARQYRR